jgi:Fic family protein
MGRFMQTAFLTKWKTVFAYIPVETIIKERQQEYYTAFQDCYADNGKSTHFIIFMLKTLLSAIQNVHRNSANMLKSQTTQIQKLMNIMEYIPFSAKEIANRLGLKSISSLKNHYLMPELELDLIAMSIPDKPTSKNQKYYKF